MVVTPLQPRSRTAAAALRWLLVPLLALATAAAWPAGMGREEARHLLNRTGFGTGPAEIERTAALSRTQAVEQLIQGTRASARTPAPEWTQGWQPPPRFKEMSAEERKVYQRELIERWRDLKVWWLTEMLATDSQLTERMTLFWHNHFTSSLQKVRLPVLMYRQNVLLRSHALGSFADLLHAVSKDPAMVVYLDSALNRRGHPNENFAREVMELFTLGEGHYGEQDVREAARAFTGWGMDRETGTFVFRPAQHDDGVKSVLGKSGNLKGEDVLDLLLARPETARFVAGKLWREFVSPGPASDAERSELERVARAFREAKYSTRAALRELLLTESFWAPANRATLTKSPVDLVAGTMRQFNARVADPFPLVVLLRTLGQDIFAPPNVKGWPGGTAWITSQTLLARKQFLDRLMREEAAVTPPAMMDAGAPRRRMDLAQAGIELSAADWLKAFEKRPMPGTLVSVVLAAAPVHPAPSGADGVELLRSLVADPVYQLK
jgi:uncharacterized protein (DUF1800 family)